MLKIHERNFEFVCLKFLVFVLNIKLDIKQKNNNNKEFIKKIVYLSF